ncbi:glycosyl transferase [Dulcicalothrix desertica PCC 7102]|uniref:Glycosyl transferase n=1 Tax=Dulcicalothrix desertica PCC 7102 TaxID=232991 RepID=A0A433V591_9CYAN|nr:glycosyltransferase family 2 protein [Dulcicalothrix desertica]RUT01221.1 glycosyl transferase [Dulcicalothrix desertica PCC 7102]TWH40627.1 glycosyltransferase involved in cell wall biosynthesis [Dulcicalothrix desertica PCC 7102]
MKLSLCIIAKNEESTLAKCIRSATSIVDEVVVLDTGSIDKTVRIAEELGAKVYRYEWNNDFSAARNEALRYVTGDWVLVLDADERLTPKIKSHIQQTISMQEYIMVNLLRHEIGAAQSPYSMVSRLFRKHPDIKFSRPYHAIIDDSVIEILQKEPDWQIGHLSEVAILHEGYTLSAIKQENKATKAQAAMEGFIVHHPNDPYVCSKLGGLYIENGKLEEGIELLQRGIASKQANIDLMYELHYHLGIGYTRVGDIRKAVSHYQAAIKQVVIPILKLGAYNNLGSLLKSLGDLQSAKSAYEMTTRIDPNFAIGHYNLGMTLKAMGKFTEAISSYQRAVQLDPKYASAYQNLGVVWLKVGNQKASLAAFNKAISLHEQDNPIEAARLRQGLQEMGLI